jgi:hypothetical protein
MIMWIMAPIDAAPSMLGGSGGGAKEAANGCVDGEQCDR